MPLIILFTFPTCGIYSLYWILAIQDWRNVCRKSSTSKRSANCR
ncbi:DUF4234 domain-containing protein [Erwinia sp. CPCC 100877]|nr:DUF4234 domain-containing protein [Erwinia sp. CPCC 100877]